MATNDDILTNSLNDPFPIREGQRYRFTRDCENSGWTFAAGDVVTLTSTYVAYLDWFKHRVVTAAGEQRNIGAGVIGLYTEPA